MLDLMYITNKPAVAEIAQNNGVNRIFVDMEYMGKSERQGGMDTVQNHHKIEDIKRIKAVLTSSKLLVRVNPVHADSEKEINASIAAGADIIMLPMWKTKEDAARFAGIVDGRAKTMLLLENKEALRCVDDVLQMGGIDEIHIGLNDLHLSLKKKFLFELLADGTVEALTKKLSASGIPYGFGGFGRIGEGLLPADYIVAEHYRLGSSMSILSRAFCNTEIFTKKEDVAHIFDEGIRKLRAFEAFLETCDEAYFEETHSALCRCVKKIVGEM